MVVRYDIDLYGSNRKLVIYGRITRIHKWIYADIEHPRESLICHLKDIFLSYHTDVYNIKGSRICQGSSLSNETDRFKLGLEMTKEEIERRGGHKGWPWG